MNIIIALLITMLSGVAFANNSGDVVECTLSQNVGQNALRPVGTLLLDEHSTGKIEAGKYVFSAAVSVRCQTVGGACDNKLFLLSTIITHGETSSSLSAVLSRTHPSNRVDFRLAANDFPVHVSCFVK